MVLLNLQQYPPPPPSPAAARLVAFTTPQNYARRLSHLINLNGWTPLWCPTVTVEPTPPTISAVQHFLLPPDPPLRHFSAVAFTSRTGITAFSQALSGIDAPPLSPIGETFTISALGKDSELLDESFIGKLCEIPGRIRVLVPPVATPSGMVEALGLGLGRKVLCPVPAVIGLKEPPVVPKLLADLERRGWAAVRVNAYETRWRSCCIYVGNGFKDRLGTPKNDAIFKSINSSHFGVNGLKELTFQDTKPISQKFEVYTPTNFSKQELTSFSENIGVKI